MSGRGQHLLARLTNLTSHARTRSGTLNKFKKNKTMAETDAIAARREARRRRILENSEHRLKKITGVCKTGGDDDSAPDIHSIQQSVSSQNVKKDVTTDVHSGLTGKESLTSGREGKSSLTDVIHDSSSEFSVLQSSTSDEDVKFTESSSVMKTDDNELIRRENIIVQQEVEPVLQTLHSARLHLVVLAAVVRLLLSMNYGFLFAESAFVPFFSLECVEYAVERHSSGGGSKSSMLSAALLLSGIAPQQVAVMNRALHTLQRCMLDFNLYFFAFIVVHVFVEILR